VTAHFRNASLLRNTRLESFFFLSLPHYLFNFIHVCTISKLDAAGLGNMTASSKSSFLALPVELRTQIYQLLFQDASLQITQEYRRGRPHIITPSFESAILRTCKQVYLEAQPVVADNLTVHLDTGGPGKALKSIKQKHRRCYDRYIQFARSLNIDSYQDIRGLEFLQSFSRLQTIHLRGRLYYTESFKDEIAALAYYEGRNSHEIDLRVQERAKEMAKAARLVRASKWLNETLEKLPDTLRITTEAEVLLRYPGRVYKLPQVVKFASNRHRISVANIVTVGEARLAYDRGHLTQTG
jgi:hypothetical protein